MTGAPPRRGGPWAPDAHREPAVSFGSPLSPPLLLRASSRVLPGASAAAPDAAQGSFPCCVVSEDVFRPAGRETLARLAQLSGREVAAPSARCAAAGEVDVAFADAECLAQFLRQRAKIPPRLASLQASHGRSSCPQSASAAFGKSPPRGRTRLPGVSLVCARRLQRAQLALLSGTHASARLLASMSLQADAAEVRRQLAAAVAWESQRASAFRYILAAHGREGGPVLAAELALHIRRGLAVVASSPFFASSGALRTRARPVHAAFLPFGCAVAFSISAEDAERGDTLRLPAAGEAAGRAWGEGEMTVAVLQEEDRDGRHGLLEIFPSEKHRRSSPGLDSASLDRSIRVPLPYVPTTFWGVRTPQGESGAVVLAQQRPPDDREAQALSCGSSQPSGLTAASLSSSPSAGSFVAFSVTTPGGRLEPRPLLFTCCRCCVASRASPSVDREGGAPPRRTKNQCAAPASGDQSAGAPCGADRWDTGRRRPGVRTADSLDHSGKEARAAAAAGLDGEMQEPDRVSDEREDAPPLEGAPSSWSTFLNLPAASAPCPSLSESNSSSFPSSPSMASTVWPPLEVLWVSSVPGLSLCLAYAPETRFCVLCLLLGRVAKGVRGGDWCLRAQLAVGGPRAARRLAARPFAEQLEARLRLSAPSLHALQLFSFRLPGDAEPLERDPRIESEDGLRAPEEEGAMDAEEETERRTPETGTHHCRYADSGDVRGDRSRRGSAGLLPAFLTSSPPQVLLLPASLPAASRACGDQSGSRGGRAVAGASGVFKTETSRGSPRRSDARTQSDAAAAAAPPSLEGRRRNRVEKHPWAGTRSSRQARLRLVVLDERTETLALIPLPSSLATSSSLSPSSPSCYPRSSLRSPASSSSCCLRLAACAIERVKDVVGFVAVTPDESEASSSSALSLSVSRLLHLLDTNAGERTTSLSFAFPLLAASSRSRLSPRTPSSASPESLRLSTSLRATSLPAYLVVLHRGGLLGLYAGAYLLSFLHVFLPPPSSLTLSPACASSPQEARRRETEQVARETQRPFPVAVAHAVGDRFNLTFLAPLRPAPSQSLSAFSSPPRAPAALGAAAAFTSSGGFAALSTYRCALQVTPSHPLLRLVISLLLPTLPPSAALRLLRSLFRWVLNPRASAGLAAERRDARERTMTHAAEAVRLRVTPAVAWEFGSPAEASSFSSSSLEFPAACPTAPTRLRGLCRALAASETPDREREWTAFCLVLLAEATRFPLKHSRDFFSAPISAARRLAASSAPATPAASAPGAACCSDGLVALSLGAALAAAQAVASGLREGERNREDEAGTADAVWGGRSAHAASLPRERGPCEEERSRGGSERDAHQPFIPVVHAADLRVEATEADATPGAGARCPRDKREEEAEACSFLPSPFACSSACTRRELVRRATQRLLGELLRATHTRADATAGAAEAEEKADGARGAAEGAGTPPASRADAALHAFDADPFLGPLVKDALEDETEEFDCISNADETNPALSSQSASQRPPLEASSSGAVGSIPRLCEGGGSPREALLAAVPSFGLRPHLPQIFLSLHALLEDASLLRAAEAVVQRPLARLLLLLARLLRLPRFFAVYAARLSAAEARRLDALLGALPEREATANEGVTGAWIPSHPRAETAQAGSESGAKLVAEARMEACERDSGDIGDSGGGQLECEVDEALEVRGDADGAEEELRGAAALENIRRWKALPSVYHSLERRFALTPPAAAEGSNAGEKEKQSSSGAPSSLRSPFAAVSLPPFSSTSSASPAGERAAAACRPGRRLVAALARLERQRRQGATAPETVSAEETRILSPGARGRGDGQGGEGGTVSGDGAGRVRGAQVSSSVCPLSLEKENAERDVRAQARQQLFQLQRRRFAATGKVGGAGFDGGVSAYSVFPSPCDRGEFFAEREGAHGAGLCSLPLSSAEVGLHFDFRSIEARRSCGSLSPSSELAPSRSSAAGGSLASALHSLCAGSDASAPVGRRARSSAPSAAADCETLQRTREAWRIVGALLRKTPRAARNLVHLQPVAQSALREALAFLAGAAADVLGARRLVRDGQAGNDAAEESEEEGDLFVTAALLAGRRDFAANAVLLLASSAASTTSPSPLLPSRPSAAPLAPSPPSPWRASLDLQELVHLEASCQARTSGFFWLAPREVSAEASPPVSPLPSSLSSTSGESGVLTRWGGVAPNMSAWAAARPELRARLLLVASALDTSSLRVVVSRLSPQAADVLDTIGESHALLAPAAQHLVPPPQNAVSASFLASPLASSLGGISSPRLPASTARHSGRAAGSEDEGRASALPLLLQKLSPLDSALALASRDRGVALQQALAVGRGALTLGALGRFEGGARDGRDRELLPLSLLDVPPIELRVLLAPYAAVAKDGEESSADADEAELDRGSGSDRRGARGGERPRRFLVVDDSASQASSEEESLFGFSAAGRGPPGAAAARLASSPSFTRDAALSRRTSLFASAAVAPALSLPPGRSGERRRRGGRAPPPFTFVPLPAQLVSRDPQRQPPEGDAWAQFHNGCASGLALLPAAISIEPAATLRATPTSHRRRHRSPAGGGAEAAASWSPSREGETSAEGRGLRGTDATKASAASAGGGVASQGFASRNSPEFGRGAGRRDGKRRRSRDGDERRADAASRDGLWAHLFPWIRPSSAAAAPAAAAFEREAKRCKRDSLSHNEQLAAFLRRHAEAYGPHEFGGLVLALGLCGFFRVAGGARKEELQTLSLRLLWDAFDRETVQTGLLLGLAGSAVGSRSQALLQLCAAHLPYALTGQFIETEMHPAPQCAALVALGLVFARSQSRGMSATLLHHLLRSPCLLADKQGLDRDACALSAAWSLGVVWLGHRRRGRLDGGRGLRRSRRLQGEEGADKPRASREAPSLAQARHAGAGEAREGAGRDGAAGAARAGASRRAAPRGGGVGEARSDRESCGRDGEKQEEDELSLFWRELITLANLNTSRPWGSFYREPLKGALRRGPLRAAARFSLFASGVSGVSGPRHVGPASRLPLLQESWTASHAPPHASVAATATSRGFPPAEACEELSRDGTPHDEEATAPPGGAASRTRTVLARALIFWSAITPSHRWVAAQIPPLLRLLPSDFSESQRNPLPFRRVVCPATLRILPVARSSPADSAGASPPPSPRSQASAGAPRSPASSAGSSASACSAAPSCCSCSAAPLSFPFAAAAKYRAHALAGALWALGLRYAGTRSRRCIHLLLRYLHYLRGPGFGRPPSAARGRRGKREACGRGDRRDGRRTGAEEAAGLQEAGDSRGGFEPEYAPVETGDVSRDSSGTAEAPSRLPSSASSAGAQSPFPPFPAPLSCANLLSPSQSALFLSLPSRFSLPLPAPGSPAAAFAATAAHVDEEARDLCALVCCLALACVAAGSCDDEVLSALFAERQLRLSRPRPETVGGATAVAAAAAVVAAAAAAGLASEDTASATAAAETAAACARAAEENEADAQYGALLLLHQAIGFVCMAGGRRSFEENSFFATAVLVMALFPVRPPSDPADQSAHLQAARHLWVLATEPRHLAAIDADAGQRVALPVSLLVRRAGTPDEAEDAEAVRERRRAEVKRVDLWLPGWLPSPRRILQLHVTSDRYAPLVLRREPRLRMPAEGAAEDAPAAPSLFARLLHLGGFFVQRRDSAVPYRGRPVSCEIQQTARRTRRSFLPAHACLRSGLTAEPVKPPRASAALASAYAAAVGEQLRAHVESLEAWQREEGNDENLSKAVAGRDTSGAAAARCSVPPTARQRRFGAQDPRSLGGEGTPLREALKRILPQVNVAERAEAVRANRDCETHTGEPGDAAEGAWLRRRLSRWFQGELERSREERDEAMLRVWQDSLSANAVSLCRSHSPSPRPKRLGSSDSSRGTPPGADALPAGFSPSSTEDEREYAHRREIAALPRLSSGSPARDASSSAPFCSNCLLEGEPAHAGAAAPVSLAPLRRLLSNREYDDADRGSEGDCRTRVFFDTAAASAGLPSAVSALRHLPSPRDVLAALALRRMQDFFRRAALESVSAASSHFSPLLFASTGDVVEGNTRRLSLTPLPSSLLLAAACSPRFAASMARPEPRARTAPPSSSAASPCIPRGRPAGRAPRTDVRIDAVSLLFELCVTYYAAAGLASLHLSSARLGASASPSPRGSAAYGAWAAGTHRWQGGKSMRPFEERDAKKVGRTEEEGSLACAADALSAFLLFHRLPLLHDWLEFVHEVARCATQRRPLPAAGAAASSPAFEKRPAEPDAPATSEAPAEQGETTSRMNAAEDFSSEKAKMQRALYLSHQVAAGATVRGKLLLADALLEVDRIFGLLEATECLEPCADVARRQPQSCSRC
ncbi:hypothetical protein BESB_033650 [Besnoitia besnoiti]|uniref:Uncharacterized protein n=1 Tax=Besnoitia besnoiti TaxID=94643 RepID=A0A2A9MMC5_BESBE|nr:hypothetical protein BESB_033650 [Besnoitia besnoiti]PFH36907.1 hypothetical protein BESB_033650 [Besnoitia besnoiti]